MINYMFYTLVSLGCSFLVYSCFLKRQKTFQFNRVFLLATLVLCMASPLMKVELFDAVPSITQISLHTDQDIPVVHENLEGVTVLEVEKPSYSMTTAVWYAYILISLCFSFRFVKNLIDILKRSKRHYDSFGPFKLIETDTKNASSFFNYLFVNSESLNDEHYVRSMIQHELVHYKQGHTIDVLLMEALLCLFWFNPLIWLYRRAVVQNHEFIADNYTIKSGIDLEDYAHLIINSGRMEHRVPLTSGFNFIQIKNRIIMLHQSKSSILKRTLTTTTALLLFSGIFMLSSFKDSKKPLVVIVDAAHGGVDSGHLNEKDIVLKISNELMKFSDNTVKLITLRSEDKFFSLNERVKFINAQNPDLMISLHCNSAPDAAAKGLEVFYYDNEKTNKESLKYGMSLINQQLPKNFDNAKMKTAGFKILKDIKCPGVLLELGFLSNPEDKAKLNNHQFQQEIAKALYEGLAKASKIKL
ncbi:M56/M15 family metallopeptidase [uncultured Psychroserpens sp.]|uniref:M56/M15 family metallopeptidase n=1 Tax=uncultured Psychroserpens sp. TaxID=255436 RepID=UPI0026137332|nr:M56/M15 family metallopeptidase [uncultured Psychroserpens sp.]